MAEFNPKLNVPGDPSYIGYSKKTSGDRSLSTLVSNLGNLTVAGFKAGDELIEEQVKGDVQESIFGETQTSGPLNAEADAKREVQPVPTNEGSFVDVFSEDRLQSNPDINQTTVNARKLTEAYRQGKVTATHYWGHMNKEAKRLKAQYPGYGNVIDRQFQGLTGNIPANALASATRKEYTDHLAKIDEEEKSYQKFVQKNLEYLAPDYFERAKAGDPYTKLEVYERVHRLQSRELSQKYDKDKLAIATSQGNLNQENAIGVAQNHANQTVNAALADSASQNLLNTITSAQTAAAKGQLPSPQEQTALRAAAGAMRARIQNRVESLMRSPSSDGQHTYYSMIKDPAKVRKIVDEAMAPVGNALKLLDDGDFGLFALGVNYTKALEQDAKRALYESSPIWTILNAAKDAGGSQFVAQASFYDRFMAAEDTTTKALVDLARTRMAAGDPSESTAKKVDEIIQSPDPQKTTTVEKGYQPTEAQKAGARAIIRESVAGLTHPTATMTTKSTAAREMFGPKNGNFLRRFSHKNQIELFDQLVSPAVTRVMSELRDQDPKLFQDYSNWAKSSFIALQRANAATIQEGFSEREEIQLSWDGKANQFVSKKTPLGVKRALDRVNNNQSVVSEIEGQFTSDVELAVQDFNRQVKLLEGIVKIEGGDVGKEIQTLLAAMNINPLTEKQKTVFQKFRNLLDEYVSEKESPPKK